MTFNNNNRNSFSVLTGGTVTKSVVHTLLIVLFAVMSQSAIAKSKRILPRELTIYMGESKVIKAPGATRISVGNSGLVSSTLLKTGEVVLTADKTGQTNMQVWYTDGHRENLPIIVVTTNGWRDAIEVKALLGDIKGVKIKTVGRRVVVDGNLEKRDLDRVNLVKERYPDMLILAREITPYEQKMVYFDVKITEFDRDKTENLGIDWSKNFQGPSLDYAHNWSQKGNVTPDFSGNSVQGAFDNWNPTVTGGGFHWGIATEITSMINMLEQAGSAIILSEPRLSARSGGTADLTVGGEVPVVTSSVSGSSVEYKDYGIILGISPSLDLYNNITARVSVSISQLDLANAVSGQPAFKKRSTENDVKLRPGETLVLSGLITRDEQVTSNNVKWLADIPILGALFRSKSFTSGVTEMVIFITPRVIENPATGVNMEEIQRADRMIRDFEKASGHSILD